MNEVPFSDHHGLIAGFLERLRQQPFVCRKAVFAGSWNDQGLQTITERISAGHQRSAGRGTHRLYVELFEPRAILCESIDIRGLDIGAVKSDVRDRPPRCTRCAGVAEPTPPRPSQNLKAISKSAKPR